MKPIAGVLALVLAVGAFAAAGLLLEEDGADQVGSGGSGELNLEAVPEAFWAALLDAAGRCEGVSGPLLAAQIEVESGWDPAATSAAGAQGIAQFMPGTWSTWGKDYSGDGVADVFDATDAIGSQADYMCHLRSLVDEGLASGSLAGDGVQLTLASYNAGPGAVSKHAGVPRFAETTRYIKKILAAIAKYTAATSAGQYAPGDGPPVSDDGTYRVPRSGSGNLDPSTLCQIPWATSGLVLRCDATAALSDLNAAYQAQFGEPLGISSAYRDYATQVRTKASKGYLAAEPGTSNHGWGLAVDLSGIGGEGTTRHNWLRANAPAFGWQHPSWARSTGSKPESWHWEYVGVIS